MLEDFASLGYEAQAWVLCSFSYGSHQKRNRFWLVALLRGCEWWDGPGGLQTSDDFDSFFAVVTSRLREMEIAPPPLCDAMLPDDHPIIVAALEKHLKTETTSDVQEKWPKKHQDYCRAASIRWPVPPHPSTAASRWYSGLSVREKGCVNTLQTQWGKDTSVDISQELEMQRIHKKGETHIPTLLPGTKFYISNFKTHEVSRLLTGLEMLRLQCYPVSDEQYQKADFVDSLCADLAGPGGPSFAPGPLGSVAGGR